MTHTTNDEALYSAGRAFGALESAVEKFLLDHMPGPSNAHGVLGIDTLADALHAARATWPGRRYYASEMPADD